MVEVDIFVTSKIPNNSKCRFCKSKEVLLRTEVENDNEVFVISLCKLCARELKAQLECFVP